MHSVLWVLTGYSGNSHGTHTGTRVVFGFYGYSWAATRRALVQVLKQNYQIHDTGEQPDLKVLMTGLTIIEQRMKDLMSIAENEKHHAKQGQADAKHPA